MDETRERIAPDVTAPAMPDAPRQWTLAELDELAERGALAMRVSRWGDGELVDGEPATHRYRGYESQIDGTLQIAVYSVASDVEWHAAAGWCDCTHYSLRCQRVPGARCKHQEYFFPDGRPRPEIPVLDRSGQPIDGDARRERARRRAAAEAEIAEILA